MPEMTSAVGDLLHPRHKFLEETPHNLPAFVQYLTDELSSFQSRHKSTSSLPEAFTPRFDVIETKGAYYLAGEFAGLADKSAISIEWGGDGRTLIIDGQIPRFNPEQEWQNATGYSNPGGFTDSATQSSNSGRPTDTDMTMEERERAQEEGRGGLEKPDQGMQPQSQLPIQQGSGQQGQFDTSGPQQDMSVLQQRPAQEGTGQQGQFDTNGHQQEISAQQQRAVPQESGHQNRFDKLIHGRQPEKPAQSQRPMQPESGQHGQHGQSGQSGQYGQPGHQDRFDKHGRPRVWLSERHTGEFTRSFTFPSRIEAEGLRARLSDGLLRIVVPKGREEEHRKSRHIAIE